MLDRLTSDLQYHAKALTLRADRQGLIAANIANADTPNFKARDVDFATALANATGRTPGSAAPAAAADGRPAMLPVASRVSADDSGPPAVPSATLSTRDARHLPTAGTGQAWSTASLDAKYRVPEQAAMDGNTVELDRERAAFADNAVKYEATLRFINGNVRTILSAIRGADA
ncbi:MAG TPA: flagellar basal body rod protein FlgB [Burkholderiaceae bacterium]|nr:flagellar basal body rod protein FlgB [Burkholderiaceae bacterium]